MSKTCVAGNTSIVSLLSNVWHGSDEVMLSLSLDVLCLVIHRPDGHFMLITIVSNSK